MKPERWQEIERLCRAALAMKPGKREKYIEEACAGDESLRKEVTDLLAQQSKVEDFLEDPAIEVAAKALAKEQENAPARDLTGSTISHYRIVEKIGTGGMGEVYKARDMHLDRIVAIKVLSPEKVSDPERKQRFIQEAKAASVLDHPNIITVYDVDEADGLVFIVMEYLPGKTLRDLISRKGMRLNDILSYSVQIADALATAHEAGIIHRDVKPGNVIVSDKGVVKVLDFGLVKLSERAPLGSDEPPEAENPVTEPGMIMGTTAYMSPEQAEGRTVDGRSDIFSFGAMLYEIVGGKRAFQKESNASTMAAIITQEPGPLPLTVPHDLEKAITRCLHKDPEHRFQHMADIKVVLEELKEESESGKLAAARVAEQKRSPRWIWAGAAAVLLLAVLVWRMPEVSPPSDLKPSLLTSYSGAEYAPSFSPDGNKVAFTWNGEQEDNYDIYIKQIGSAGTPMRLTTSPERDESPAWSPDDLWIAFVSWGQNRFAIKLISPFGGVERTLAEDAAIHLRGASVPSWRPDAKWLAYSALDSERRQVSIWAISIDTGERRRLTTFVSEIVDAMGGILGDSAPSISPDGRTLAFARQVGLYVYELYKLRLTEDMWPDGEPMKVTDGQYGRISGIAWTSDGREIIYDAAINAGGLSSLWRVSVSGKGIPTRLTFAHPSDWYPAIACTVPRLAYTWNVIARNIWRLDTRTNERKMLIGSTYTNICPAYSPDGLKIAVNSNRSGEMELWICDADGTNAVQITSLGRGGGSPHWSPDGRWLAFDIYVDGQGEIYVIAADGGAPRNITNNAAQEINPSWSRDGKWIYFASDRTGQYQIWKVPKDGVEAVQVTYSGGVSATESPKGEYVYFSKHAGLDIIPPLFRMPTNGGIETEVLSSIYSGPVVTEKGVYFMPDQKTVQMLDPETGRITTLATLEREAEWLSVSPDDAYILWSQEDQNTTDLMLVDGFR